MLQVRRGEVTTQLDASDLRVLDLVSQGWSSDAIAADLNIHPRTVTRRLKRCCIALGASDRVAAVVNAIHLGSIRHRRRGGMHGLDLMVDHCRTPQWSPKPTHAREATSANRCR
jgi:IS30 family transposase